MSPGAQARPLRHYRAEGEHEGMIDPIDSGKLDWIWDGRLKERLGYSDETLETVARVLSRACPHCRADVGQWCRTASGRQLDDLDQQHLARRTLHYRPMA